MTTRPAILLLTILVSGCWARPDIPASAFPNDRWESVSGDDQKNAFSRLTQVEPAHFDSAWSSIRAYDFTIGRTIVVRDESGEVVAQTTHAATVSGPPDSRQTTVLKSDSSGSFERSFWSRFSDAGSPEPGDGFVGPPEVLPGLVLPTDPQFLSEQGPSYFMYRSRPDTTLGGKLVEVIETRVRPETSRHGIQWARFYVRRDSIVGLDAVFAQRSLLYQEITRARLLLTPAGTRWAPKRADLSSTVALPFARSRTYEMHVQYSNHRLVLPSSETP